tara:strand:+ start:59435 stop:60187 length:753 start_codon:yes stop_codon:yes gene_type:complete
MKNRKIKTLSFDLWLTLIYESDLSANSDIRRRIRSEKIKKKLSNYNLELSIEKITSTFNYISEAINSGHEKGLDKKFNEWVLQGLKSLVTDRDKITTKLVKDVSDVIDEAFLEHPPNLLNGVLEMITSLRKQYNIILISNTGLTSPEAYIKWFKRINLFNKFDKFFFSNDLSLAKPSEKIFRLAFKSINSLPEEVLHIGDNLNTDVCGAKNVGAQTVWISNGVTSTFSCKPDFVLESVLQIKNIFQQSNR